MPDHIFDLHKVYGILDSLDPRLNPPVQSEGKPTVKVMLYNDRKRIELILSLLTDHPKNRLRRKAKQVFDAIKVAQEKAAQDEQT